MKIVQGSRVFLIVCPLLLCSCASVSVRDVKRGESATPARAPRHVYVAPFSVDESRVKESFARKNRGQLSEEARMALAQDLAAELSRDVAPASVLKSGQAPRGDGWLVSGRITRLAEGNRLLRMGIGLGLGGTKMETEVEVRNLPASNPRLLHFSTTGGSNAEPGAATSPIPFSAAPVALLQIKGGVSDDARRTARMISGTVSNYLIDRGWRSESQRRKTKVQGQ